MDNMRGNLNIKDLELLLTVFTNIDTSLRQIIEKQALMEESLKILFEIVKKGHKGEGDGHPYYDSP